MKVGDFTASLYDLFGYLLPGLVASVALILLVSGTLDLGALTNAALLMAFLVGAYFVGHFVQAAGNLLPSHKQTRRVLKELPAEVWKQTQDLLQKRFGTKFVGDGTQSRKGVLQGVLDKVPKNEDQETVKRLLDKHLRNDTALQDQVAACAFIDESRVLGQKENERDVYVYREGFYRGTAIALSVLSVVLLGRGLFGGGVAMEWGARTLESITMDASNGGTLTLARGDTGSLLVPKWWCFGAGVAVLSMAGAFLLRMRRFIRYRIERSIYYWLALKEAPPNEKAKPGVVCVCVPGGLQDAPNQSSRDSEHMSEDAQDQPPKSPDP